MKSAIGLRCYLMASLAFGLGRDQKSPYQHVTKVFPDSHKDVRSDKRLEVNGTLGSKESLMINSLQSGSSLVCGELQFTQYSPAVVV